MATGKTAPPPHAAKIRYKRPLAPWSNQTGVCGYGRKKGTTPLSLKTDLAMWFTKQPEEIRDRFAPFLRLGHEGKVILTQKEEQGVTWGGIGKEPGPCSSTKSR